MMEENLDSPPNKTGAERRTRSSRAKDQEEAQPADNSSSQYGWLQMRGQGWVWIGGWEIGKPPEADVAYSSTYVQSNLYGAKKNQAWHRGRAHK